MHLFLALALSLGLGLGTSARAPAAPVQQGPERAQVKGFQPRRAAPAPVVQAPRRVAPGLGDPAGVGRRHQDLGFVQAPLALSSTSSSASSSSIVSVQRGSTSANGRSPALFYYTVTINPGTGYFETFILSFPTPMPQAPAPLLVPFHSFGVTAKDIVQNTPLVHEAHARGWFLVAPLGASGVHFSSLESQANTQAVLDWMLGTFNIDTQRIYGIGFSMGGGAVANYAARHLDPARAMFAAVADHTGTVALGDVYANDPSVTFILDFWYGNGTAGSAEPWKLKRSSVIDINQATLQVDPTTDLARNLGHLPFYLTRAAVDSIWYLPRQCNVLDHHLVSLGKQPGVDYEYVIEPYSGHSWSMLDFRQVCDWLSQFSLQMPSSGSTLADHDGAYFHFLVTQEVAGAFTPFTWDLDPSANKLTVRDSANLKRLAVDTLSAQLDPTQPIRLVLATADGLADEIALLDVPQAPSQVLRDSIPAPAPSWVYQPQTKQLVLIETDGTSPHVWEIVP